MSGNGIVRVVTKVLLPYIFLFALYVQFHGDYGPGGGFQAGVIFAAGFILHALIFGLTETRKVMGQRLLEIGISAGVLLYGGVGLWCLYNGGTYLDYDVLDPHDPVHGQHLGILLVELGVGITVTMAIVSIFFDFAGRGNQEPTP
jgi:multicomponent Na+:H+ antiporter subunit B